MTHLLGIVGLSLNTIGALLLLWFPPDVRRYTEQGAMVVNAVLIPLVENVPRYWRQKWGFRVAIGFLVLGFILQGFDLIAA
jgi:hypothetical protein